MDRLSRINITIIIIFSETNNGFTCPEKAPTDEFGQFDPHPK